MEQGYPMTDIKFLGRWANLKSAEGYVQQGTVIATASRIPSVVQRISQVSDEQSRALFMSSLNASQ